VRARSGGVLSGSITIDLKLRPKLRHPLPITGSEGGGERLPRPGRGADRAGDGPA